MQLNNKIAIVTGASAGLGAEFSKSLIEKGATVYGLARRKVRLVNMQQSLGERFVGVEMDVTREDRVRKWVSDTFSGMPPDILINNAGVGYFADIDKLTSTQWHSMIDVNLNAVFYMTSAVVPLMKQNFEVCHIINIASIAGKLGNPRLSGYNATKFALRGFSDALMKELRDFGIKVSCLFPGSVATEFSSVHGGSNHPNMMLPEDIASTVIHILELPDSMLIDEIVMRPTFPKK